MIRRGVERQLIRHQRLDVDVLDLIVVRHGIKQDNPTQPERILAAARVTAGYHALIAHLDADAPTAQRAYQERFAPGLARVLQAQEPVCNTLVPLIPIHSVEAWMLADGNALRQVIGVTADLAALSLPANARAIEADSNPKATLAQAVRRALAMRTRRRRRHFDIGSIYEPLAQLIQLDLLEELSAYRRFQHDLRQMLIGAKLLEPSST